MSKDRLTKKEEDQMLDDLSSMIAVVIAQQEYLKSIGKFEESKVFVQKYLADLKEKAEKRKTKKKVN